MKNQKPDQAVRGPQKLPKEDAIFFYAKRYCCAGSSVGGIQHPLSMDGWMDTGSRAETGTVTDTFKNWNYGS
jgi:hypothetical protein